MQSCIISSSFLRVYCEYKYDQHQEDQSPEALIKDFLSRAQKPNWKWRSTRTRPPPEPTMSQAQCKYFSSFQVLA